MTIVKNEKSRGRPRAFDRETAVGQAMEVFWAQGYEGASMPLLTKAMGISAQSLYAAYGSKQALYREAMERYRTTIGGFGQRALEEEGDALQAIVRLLRDAAITFSEALDQPGCMITTAPAGIADDELILYGRQLRTNSRDMVCRRLERGIEDGQLLADTDCAAWARYVSGIVQGMSVQARDGETRSGLLSIAEIAAGALEALRKS
jgi:AcrR family transcriptional regulator